MTKVVMTMDLLEYQQCMKEDLRQVLQQNYIAGIRQAEQVEIPLAQENLLPPPCILCIFPDGYNAQGNDYIAVATSSDFGIHSIHITIMDDHGNLIESGEMTPFPENSDLWEYLPEGRAPLGTNVIIQVTAMDCMGGIGRRWIGKTLGEDWP